MNINNYSFSGKNRKMLTEVEAKNILIFTTSVAIGLLTSRLTETRSQNIIFTYTWTRHRSSSQRLSMRRTLTCQS